MELSLSPELEQFINDEVKAGRYASPGDVVEDALSRLLMEVGAGPVEEIDDETHAALRRSEEQIRRGEGRTIDEVRDHFRQRGVRLGPSQPSGER